MPKKLEISQIDFLFFLDFLGYRLLVQYRERDLNIILQKQVFR